MGMRENMRGGCEFWKFGGARIGASKNWECIHKFLGREGFRERRGNQIWTYGYINIGAYFGIWEFGVGVTQWEGREDD